MLMLNFYSSAGTPAGDFEGRRPFVRVPDDDLSCQVMTFPGPATVTRKPERLMHPADVPGSVLRRAAALGDRLVHRYMTTAFIGLIIPTTGMT